MLGIMPGHIYQRGTVGLVTRSGTLGYEAASQMKALGIGISTSVGIGGDPINGSSFVDILQRFEEDPETEAVMMIGEIGGPQEAEAARFAKEHMKKPVIGYVAGLTAPKGRRMGHAGAIIRAFGESAAEKVEIMKEAGITVVPARPISAPRPRGCWAGCPSAWRSRRERAAGRGRDPPAARAGAPGARARVRRAAQPGRPPAHGGRPAATRSPRADALLTTVTDKVTDEVLAAEPRRAKLVANFGVGFNNIDVEAAKARGIAVSNTPDVLTDATADLAMTLLLMVARRTGEGERHLRGGQWTGWRPTHMLGTQVTGQDARLDRHGADRARGGAARPSRVRDEGDLPRSVSAAGRRGQRARRRAARDAGRRAARGGFRLAPLPGARRRRGT